MDFLGSLISGGMGMLGAYQNFEHQKKLMAQQNQYNIDMWKMQAEYNSPQAQMQRFLDAGLNPNLIYGQGNSGNMSSAPIQSVPSAPDYSGQLSKIGEAFNIEGLRTMVANRKKAEEEAKQAKLTTFDKEDQREALHSLGALYEYNPETGRYTFSSPGDVVVEASNPRGSNYGYAFTRRGLMQRMLAENAIRTALIPGRTALMSTQRAYLQPQIAMSRYEQRYQPYSFWIGQGSKVLNALPLPKFTIKHDFGRKDYYKHY